jgi:hypothetical protein
MHEPQNETWPKLVALTVIVLALLAGFSALKAVSFATLSRIYAAREAQQWRDYQVESLKKDNYGMNRDILASLKLTEAKAARAAKTLAAKIKAYEDEMGRLNQERDQIKTAAQKLATQEETLERQAGKFVLAVILFQLAIMSSATALLGKKKILWLLGLGLGGWGLVYMGMALLL